MVAHGDVIKPHQAALQQKKSRVVVCCWGGYYSAWWITITTRLQYCTAMSVVWDYFKVCPTDSKVAICNDCKEAVRRGGTKTSSFNTSNLIGHLQRKHKEIYDAYKKRQEEKKKQRPATASFTQQNIKESAEKKQVYSHDHPRAKQITEKIMEFIALDNQPFSVVEDKGFINLIKTLEPRYEIRSRKYFTEQALPALYNKVFKHTEKLVSEAESISFTTDIWSSGHSQVSMLSLTAQWLDENFAMKKAVLHSQECRGSHTYDKISDAFEGMFEKWSIPKTKAHVVVRDNARNMAKATVEFGVSSLPCMAHTLQLAVKGGALNQRSISEALAVGRQMVGHFKHSPLAYSRLEDIQRELKKDVKKLHQDVSTRWNSTYYMMKSLVEQKRALSVYSTEYDIPATLQPSQWAVLEKMIMALEPFEEITRNISRAEATAADAVPAVVSLKRLLAQEDGADHGVKTAKRMLLAAVSDRFKEIQTEPLHVIATIVDARFKDRFFDMDKKVEARNMLLKVVDEMTRATSDPGPGEAAGVHGEATTDEENGGAAGAHGMFFFHPFDLLSFSLMILCLFVHL